MRSCSGAPTGASRRCPGPSWRGRKLEQPQSELVWTKKIQKENKRRASRAAKLKTLGYEFEAPQLKPAAEALGDSKAAPEPVEQNGHEPEDAQKLIEPEAPATAPTTAVVDAQEDGEAAMPEETKAAEPKKASKGKKTKSRKASRGKGAEETPRLAERNVCAKRTLYTHGVKHSGLHRDYKVQCVSFLYFGQSAKTAGGLRRNEHGDIRVPSG